MRWIAPQTGVYRMEGNVIGLQSDLGSVPTTDFQISLNSSTVLFATAINSLTVPIRYDIVRDFAVGDAVYFAVGDGGNGFVKDGTGVSIIVTSAAVPEPSSIWLCLTATISVVVWAQRRNWRPFR